MMPTVLNSKRIYTVWQQEFLRWRLFLCINRRDARWNEGEEASVYHTYSLRLISKKTIH